MNSAARQTANAASAPARAPGSDIAINQPNVFPAAGALLRIDPAVAIKAVLSCEISQLGHRTVLYGEPRFPTEHEVQRRSSFPV